MKKKKNNSAVWHLAIEYLIHKKITLFCQTWVFLFSWKSAERMFMTHLGGNEDLLHTTFGTLIPSHIWEVNKRSLFPMLSWVFKRETLCLLLGEVGRDQPEKSRDEKNWVKLVCRCCGVMKLSPQKTAPEISGSRSSHRVGTVLSLHWALWSATLHPPTCRIWITISWFQHGSLAQEKHFYFSKATFSVKKTKA